MCARVERTAPEYCLKCTNIYIYLYTDIADIDTVWLENPFPLLRGRHDLWIQSDLDHPASNVWAMLCVSADMLANAAEERVCE